MPACAATPRMSACGHISQQRATRHHHGGCTRVPGRTGRASRGLVRGLQLSCRRGAAVRASEAEHVPLQPPEVDFTAGIEQTEAVSAAGSSAKAPEGLLRLAARRAVEAEREAPLFADHASKYLTTSEHIDAAREASSAEDYAPHDEIATRFIDDLLLMYVTKESSPADEREFNQLVVVGDTHDTRALRLPLPRGTAVYLVGPLDGHIDAERRLKAAGDARPRVAPGCVLRRVAVELGASDDTWLEKLEAAGFRGDRLSVWCLQGLAEAASGDVGAAFAHTLSEVADGAALGSVVLVDARGDKGAVEECLATNGLLGGCLPYGGEDTSFGRWREEDDAVVPVQEGRWLAVAEQQRTSLAQMDDFYRYGAEMEDAGEDWDASWNYS